MEFVHVRDIYNNKNKILVQTEHEEHFCMMCASLQHTASLKAR